jgi:hypothetical protein
LAAGVLAASLAGIALVMFSTAGRPLGELPLPDGSRLVLKAVRVGRRHTNPFAPPIERLLALLPVSLKSVLRPGYATTYRPGNATVTNFLSCWLTVESSDPPTRSPSSGFEMVVQDDEGNSGGGLNLASGTLPSGRPWDAFYFASYPRRSPTLRLLVYTGMSPRHFLGEIRFPNPRPYRQPSPWVVKELPVVSRAGDLDISLTSLWVGYPNPPEESTLRFDPEALRGWATFEVSSHGLPDTNWSARSVTFIRDPTGNQSAGQQWSYGIRGHETYLQFAHWPLPVTDAWNLKVEFSREGGFSPGEVWHLPRLPLEEGAVGAPMATNHMQGVNVVVFRPHPSFGRTPNFWELRVRILGEKPGWRLNLLRAADDLGNEIARSNYAGSDSEVTYYINPASEARMLDVTLAFHQSLFVDFVARPRRWSKGLPPPPID